LKAGADHPGASQAVVYPLLTLYIFRKLIRTLLAVSYSACYLSNYSDRILDNFGDVEHDPDAGCHCRRDREGAWGKLAVAEFMQDYSHMPVMVACGQDTHHWGLCMATRSIPSTWSEVGNVRRTTKHIEYGRTGATSGEGGWNIIYRNLSRIPDMTASKGKWLAKESNFPATTLRPEYWSSFYHWELCRTATWRALLTPSQMPLRTPCFLHDHCAEKLRIQKGSFPSLCSPLLRSQGISSWRRIELRKSWSQTPINNFDSLDIFSPSFRHG